MVFAMRYLQKSSQIPTPTCCISFSLKHSIDDLMTAASSPSGAEAGQIYLENEQNFIDSSRSCKFFTEEHTIVES